METPMVTEIKVQQKNQTSYHGALSLLCASALEEPSRSPFKIV